MIVVNPPPSNRNPLLKTSSQSFESVAPLPFGSRFGVRYAATAPEKMSAVPKNRRSPIATTLGVLPESASIRVLPASDLISGRRLTRYRPTKQTKQRRMMYSVFVILSIKNNQVKSVVPLTNATPPSHPAGRTDV